MTGEWEQAMRDRQRAALARKVSVTISGGVLVAFFLVLLYAVTL